MKYIIERNQGPAGFEKVLNTIEVDDGKYTTAMDVIRDHVITPFDPDHEGEAVEFEDVRPTLAIAKLPTDHDRYTDGWTCQAVCQDEGFYSEICDKD